MNKPRRISLAVVLFGVALLFTDLAVRLSQSSRRGNHPALRLADQARAQFTYGNVLETPETLPTQSASRKDWLPFSALSLQDFPKPPLQKTPLPGIVRIAFLGESAITTDATQLVEQKLASKWGDKIEFVNLGMPNATSATSLYLLRKFYQDINAHIVVLQHGYNDLLFYYGRALGAKLVFGSPEPRVDRTASSLGIPKHGGLLWHIERRFAAHLEDIPRWFWDSPVTEPMSNHWQIARFAWSSGFSLIEVQYPAPAEQDEASFEAQFQLETPLLHSFDFYRSMISKHNTSLQDLAKKAGIEVIPANENELEKRDSFLSASVLSAKGQQRWAETMAAYLSPRIEAWLKEGARLPTSPLSNAKPGRTIDKIDPSAIPNSHPRSNICIGDPCPPGACFIPAGKAVYGYENEVLARHIDVVREATGLGSPIWDEDDGPPVEVRISAFCIDRTEASESDRKLCIDAKACPYYDSEVDAKLLSRTPAVMPAPTDAEAYCAFRGGRLPTDAEWEAAARGSDARIFPWGDTYTSAEANFCGSECQYGSKNAPYDNLPGAALIDFLDTKNPYGLVDVAGNLWEWTLDCFSSSIHHDLEKGTRDPIAAPEKGCRRFLRGGGFQSYAVFLEKRNAEGLPDVDVPTRGVRCVYDFGTVHTPIFKRQQGGSR